MNDREMLQRRRGSLWHAMPAAYRRAATPSVNGHCGTAVIHFDALADNPHLPYLRMRDLSSKAVYLFRAFCSWKTPSCASSGKPALG